MTDFDAAVLDHHRARDDDAASYICGHLLRAMHGADWYWLPADAAQHVPAGFYCRACAAHHLADGAPRRPDDPAPDHRQETAA